MQMLDIKNEDKGIKRVDEVVVGDEIFFIGEWHTVTSTQKVSRTGSRSTRLTLGVAPFRFANSTHVYVRVGA